jgi:23S rRNA (cytosine1962-C5)-methyltransferase
VANLARAIELRRGRFDEQTNGWRIFNGESDNFPALVLDRFAGTLVLKLYSLAWLPRVPMLLDLLLRTFQPGRLVLRLSRNIQQRSRSEFSLSDGQILFGPEVTQLPVFLESGLRFEADVIRGQKTGFFLDQRDNRRRIGELARGQTVLNAFSFSGGFSLHAARGGAKSVTDLDISPHALDSSRRNFALNQSIPTVAACPHECIQADVFDWIHQAPSRQFGMIILDPPSLARREDERSGAIVAYRRLAADGIRWLKPGGILLAGSCSAHVTTEEFFEAVRSAARSSGRRFEERETTTHPADHPATFPEARYLKGIYLRF